MNDMEAIWTGPCGLERLDHLATDQTFQFPGINFPDQFLALRTIGRIKFNVCHFCVTIGFEFVELLGTAMVVTVSLFLLRAATMLWSIIGVFISFVEMVVVLMVILVAILVAILTVLVIVPAVLVIFGTIGTGILMIIGTIGTTILMVIGTAALMIIRTTILVVAIIAPTILI